MNPEEIKKAFEDLQKSWSDFRKVNDERLAALEKGQGVAELDTKLARIEADVAKNQKLVESFGLLEAKVNRMNLGTAGGGQRNDELRNEFNAWAHSGEKGTFKAAATSADNPSGGYFVLPELEAGIDRIAETQSVMRQLADVKQTNQAEVIIHVSQGGAGGGWVGESDTRGETASPTVEPITIPIREVYADPKASESVIEDASEDIAAWLEAEAGIKFGELEGAAFIGASGYTPKRPRGFLAYDLVANASYAWGKLGYIATGTSGAFDATNPADKIIALQHALKSKYRQGAVFLMNDATLGLARQFKNSYGYLWQPSLVVGVPSTLLGSPVHIDDNMPDVAANSYSIAFGNFKRGYAIRDRRGIKVLRDPYSTKGFVEFYTTKRVGGGVRNFEAIKLLKFAAS